MFGSTPERLYDYYDTWAVEDTEGKKWKFMYDSSITAQRRYNGRYISAGDEYKTEMVSPKLEYGEMEKEWSRKVKEKIIKNYAAQMSAAGRNKNAYFYIIYR